MRAIFSDIMFMLAVMAELADALDLGSSGNPVQVQVLLTAYFEFFTRSKGRRYLYRLFVSLTAGSNSHPPACVVILRDKR